MQIKLFLILITTISTTVYAQTDAELSGDTLNSKNRFQILKSIPATSIKNQGMSGTCWAFSSTSFLESQEMKNNFGTFDISEMFTVRNAYLEKAKNYVLRQGHAQFGEGGLGHDLLKTIAQYGAVPESEYSGLINGQKQFNHVKLENNLKNYLDSILKITPLPENWIQGYTNILNDGMGRTPSKFIYNGKRITPKEFATDILKFNIDDYVSFTSFTHHPFYESFVLEVPDNFSNGSFYNLPLPELIDVAKSALLNGYGLIWDADVSNTGFMMKEGIAINLEQVPKNIKSKDQLLEGTAGEVKYDVQERQKLFENLTTQDDHLMHIVGLEKSKLNTSYFLVKNSWGDTGKAHGFIHVSEDYFAINTISLVVPKAALDKKLLEKLKIK